MTKERMGRLGVLAAVALAALAGASTAFADSGTKPRVWTAPLAIPTYALGEANPLPALLDYPRRKWRPVYPYTFLDDLTGRKETKTYNAVYLENEYLRVTVLPELGGHLYAIYDKTAGRDVLYTNHAVKYAMVGIRGAWISGGIEWNFPDGHSLTTVSPIDYTTRVAPDGTAEIVIGDTERVQGMQWSISIRLRPGRKDVETEVTLNNRRPTPGWYWFWATAAAPATDDLRFVYPMREAIPHDPWPIFSFPKEKGVDIGTYREVTNALSLFARDSRRDFFGCYYERSDWGVVHVADHREVPGKKIWTWGTDDAGSIWVEKLTDGDGQYVEFQAGRSETQMMHELIAPHRVERFVSHWFPVNRLGGAWDEATADAALRVAVAAGKATVALNSNATFDDARLAVEAGGRSVGERRVSLDPTKTTTETVDIPADLVGKPLVVRVTAKDGRELIRYRTDTLVDGNPEYTQAKRPLAEPEIATSADQPYQRGLVAEAEGRAPESRPLFEEALKRDPGFAPAHLGMGLWYLRSGEYDRAAEHFEQALLRDRFALEARYYLGLVRRAQGRPVEAAGAFALAARAGKLEGVSHYALGEMALAAGRFDEAVDELGRAVTLDPRDLRARTVLAMAERLAGKTDVARRHIESVVAEVPLDYLALSERAKIAAATGDRKTADATLAELSRLLAREPDSVLELAFDYVSAGRPPEAIEALEAATARAGSGRVYPMISYTLGYLYERGGDRARATASYSKAAAADTALLFPHRVEEIDVLRAARAVNPNDGHAAYALGNVLAARLRGEEALAEWRDAVRLDPSNVVARRNVGRALANVTGKLDEAAGEYVTAVAAAPNEFRLYTELAAIYERMGATDRRVALLERAPESVRKRSTVSVALASAYVDAGRFADAARVFDTSTFTAGEGEMIMLALYRRAHIGLAQEASAAGQHDRAAAEYLRATDYPKNLGIGRPAFESLAREYVAAARELERAGKTADADALWQRAATDKLNSPTEPGEPWSEHYYYKAVALDHVGRRDEARALYERLARLADDRAMLAAEPAVASGAIRYALAGAGLRALGRQAEAKAALERAIALDPKSDLARNQLAEIERGTRAAGQ